MLPEVVIIDLATAKPVLTLAGEGALAQAERTVDGWLTANPQAAYGIDVSDCACAKCGETYWHEADHVCVTDFTDEFDNLS